MTRHPRASADPAGTVGSETTPGAPSRDRLTERPDGAAFRSWLAASIKEIGKTINGVEGEAGIRGNALGKFLRGERGSVASLSPLHIRRLAPVLGISEEQLLTRAGHLSHMPDRVTVDQAILSDPNLTYEDKRFLIDFYRRMKLGRPAGSSPGAD